MMMWQFLGLLGLHFIGDFVCQTHWQAQNKSKNSEALLAHVATYTLVLAVGCGILFGMNVQWFFFCIVNGALHLTTDYFTSRWTSRLWGKQDWHNFFVVIGLDQLIHQFTLAATMWWLLS